MASGLHMEVMEGTKMFEMFNTWLLKNGSGEENMLKHVTPQHLIWFNKIEKKHVFVFSLFFAIHEILSVIGISLDKLFIPSTLINILNSGGNSKPPFAKPPQQ